MKLRQLDARFLKFVNPKEWQIVQSLAEADGIQFQCPKCAEGKELSNGFVVGVHYVICWFVGKVPDGIPPGPGRWTPIGTSLDDLTFISSKLVKAYSVWLFGPGCGWHGYVLNGEAK